MYRLGDNPIKRRHRHWALLLVMVLLIGGGIVGGRRLLHTATIISPPPPPVTHQVVGSDSALQTFNESMFTLKLPQSWKYDGQKTPNSYVWQSTGRVNAGRELTVYVDTLPTTLGVNRAVAVQASGARLTVTSSVSDNCAGFTTASGSATTGTAAAKWQGLDFVCDVGNYERDVVGTVSPDGINKVVLTGATSGRHSLFFTYTDDNIQPDFTIFTAALQSFQLK